MKKALFSIVATVTVFAAGAVSSDAASIIPASTPIPDSEVIIDFEGTGLDWAYAGPVAPNEFGLGQIEPASYRASEGWRVATAAEWALRPGWENFAKPGIEIGQINGSDHSTYRYTSEYWSTFTHVDPGDAASGFLTNGAVHAGDPSLIGSLFGVNETWYVRGNSADSNPVPDTGSTLALFGAGVIGLAGVKRLQKKRGV